MRMCAVVVIGAAVDGCAMMRELERTLEHNRDAIFHEIREFALGCRGFESVRFRRKNGEFERLTKL